MMQQKKLLDFSFLTPRLMQDIEKALISELTQQELDKFGYQLRRMIRFHLAKDAGLLVVHQPDPTFAIEKRTPWTFPTKLPGQRGIVKLSKAATMKRGTGPGQAYTITFEGATDGVHWLQFLWREMTVFPSSPSRTSQQKVPLQKRITRHGRVYLYTSDAKNPRWSTDGSHPDSPFYEGGTMVKRTPNVLKLADDPSANDVDVRDLFDSATPPEKCVSGFHAAVYLIKDMEVWYRADLGRSWTITKDERSALLKAVSTTPKWVGVGRAVEKLEPQHRAALALQFPKFDYLPGDRIGPPVPRDPYDPISPLDPRIASWPNDKSPLERYQAAAAIANMKLIEDVEVDATRGVLTIHDGEKREGLSYFAALGAQGQTGYIVVDKALKTYTYHNPRMPHERFGALPRVAILLGEDAFQWGSAAAGGNKPNKRDKFYTLATARHEMAHAAHNRMALGWLLKWRDELTKEDSFEKWLGRQRISVLDKELALTAVVPPPNIVATEVLAWTEGFITALPFLPAQPGLATFPRKEEWPASISELDGLIRQWKLTSQLENVTSVRKAVESRIQAGICGVLGRDQKGAVIEWMKFLTTLDTQQATNDNEKRTLGEFKAAFGGAKSFLSTILKIAENCPS